MAAGTVSLDFFPNTIYPVSNNSCAAVLPAAKEILMINGGADIWVPTSCSSDPVIPGTQIFYEYQTFSIFFTVETITATSQSSSNENINNIDFGPLISVIIPCVFILLFFIGFHTGSQNGNR